MQRRKMALLATLLTGAAVFDTVVCRVPDFSRFFDDDDDRLIVIEEDDCCGGFFFDFFFDDCC
ncbi:MAG: hypothetical protein U1D55_13295 [Phycisphaerae bacterium]